MNLNQPIKTAFAIAFLLPLMFGATLRAQDDVVIADFEGDTFGEWKVDGTAFGPAPIKGAHTGQMAVKGFAGESLANSFYGGDVATGKLTSPEFKIERSFLGFLIGGGNHPNEACLNLIVDGKVVAMATGDDSESLKPDGLDLKAWQGKTATIEIVDTNKKGWGHLLVDQIVLTNRAVVPKDHLLEFAIDKRYLNVPLMRSKETTLHKMFLKIDGKLLGDFNVPLATEKEDFYGAIDLSQYQGQKLAVEVRKFTGEVTRIGLADEIKADTEIYEERLRPQFHFTAKRGWLNDPNGLIFHDGKFHLYYQYNPLWVHWQNMSWGHATSTDLVHWEEQPPVLYPDPKTGMCYSGAAFIDKENQLGLKTGDEDVLIAFYLRTKTGLCYAYSNDGGETMTDYVGNPVLKHPDTEKKPAGARMDTPRPLWHEATRRWITPTFDYFVNDKGESRRCVGIYSSADLKDWKYESRVTQDYWENEMCGCVDFFQLPVDGDATNQKWVMIFIDGSYIVGDFDGHTLTTLDGKPAVAEDRIYGGLQKGNYVATMTWHNMPNGRRVQIAWMAIWGKHHGMPFSQQMSIPSELSLHSTDEGPRMRMNPIKELESLRGESQSWNDVELNATDNPLSKLAGDLYEFEIDCTPGPDSETVFNFRGVPLKYDSAKDEMTYRDRTFKLPLVDGRLTLQIFLDRVSLEAYVNGGRVYIPWIELFADDNRSYSVTASRGKSKLNRLTVHTLNSIWRGGAK